MDIVDISPMISASTPVWPGEEPARLVATWTRGPSSPVTVSRLSLSTHLGAHADAPMHWVEDGAAIADVPLEPYVGRCRVIDVSAASDMVRVAHVEPDLNGHVVRVLLKTGGQNNNGRWSSDFTALDPALVDYLGEHGIRLIGVDTPSIDPAQSKAMLAHQALHRHGIAVLEGLVLDEVPAGDWELIALPLRIASGDASPVRAILRRLPP